mmetsp:Transcript_37705/g.55602  ORF Transcript_37705/g.55602 Transcript_37705/m.55602 type:complete len:436 (+) Transcript_37705:14-1321(+)
MALLPFSRCNSRGSMAALAMISHIGSKGAAARFSTTFISSSSRPSRLHDIDMQRAPCRIFPSISTATTTTRRHFSLDNNTNMEDILPNKTGDRNGLIRYQILADDGHPLRLYSRSPTTTDRSSSAMNNSSSSSQNKRSILLLHGRTWSSQPVFDLRTSNNDDKQQSTLQSLAELGFDAYALDLRGFGETPRDEGGYTTPNRCVEDVRCAIDWIARRHDENYDNYGDSDGSSNETLTAAESSIAMSTKPALLGWSQGALVAQMYAQKHGPSTLSDLVLFGTIYDPRVIYPRKPLFDESGRLISGGKDAVKPPAPEVVNTVAASLEDFTLPGTICDEAALEFSSVALAVDTVKAAWDELHEFNVCNPALVHVPTLVIVGAQDPYVQWDAQRELFERLGHDDKSMCVLPACDHAAHILKARKMFIRSVVGFLLRKDGF